MQPTFKPFDTAKAVPPLFIRAIMPALAALAAVQCTPILARGYEPLPEQTTREYLLDVGDEVRVTIAGLPNLSATYTIGEDGMITIPLVEGVKAQGTSVSRLQQDIAGILSDKQILLKPSVSVQLFKGRPFYVVGEVKKPGEYVFRPGMTVLTAIAAAGGFTFRASENKVLVTRSIGGRAVTGTVTHDRQILPGDTINVRESWF